MTPRPSEPDEERRGLYCPHGHRLMVPDPDSTEAYPPMVYVTGEWPCPEPTCTKAEIEAEFVREAQEYEAARWAEYTATW